MSSVTASSLVRWRLGSGSGTLASGSDGSKANLATSDGSGLPASLFRWRISSTAEACTCRKCSSKPDSLFAIEP